VTTARLLNTVFFHCFKTLGIWSEEKMASIGAGISHNQSQDALQSKLAFFQVSWKTGIEERNKNL
jgi:hypothetical protein